MCDYARVTQADVGVIDKVSRYMILEMRVDAYDRKRAIDDTYFAVRFSFDPKTTFPRLYGVAMRVCSTPTSFCATERVFSILNKTVTKDQNQLSSETIERIIVSRSLLSLNT